MIAHHPQTSFRDPHGEFLLARRITGKDVRLLNSLAVNRDLAVEPLAFHGVSPDPDNALDIFAAGAGQAQGAEQIVGKTRPGIGQERTAAIEDDDVSALRRRVAVGTAVNRDALAGVEGRLHGVGVDVEEVSHRRAEDDGAQQAENDGKNSEAPDPRIGPALHRCSLAAGNLVHQGTQITSLR